MKTPKELQLARSFACPNCGSMNFEEIQTDRCLVLSCVCGLKFDFLPGFMDVTITHDPRPDI
jgi:transcription elongation factor Elf1